MLRFIVHDLCSRGYAVQIGNLTQCLLWLKYSGDCFLYCFNSIYELLFCLFERSTFSLPFLNWIYYVQSELFIEYSLYLIYSGSIINKLFLTENPWFIGFWLKVSVQCGTNGFLECTTRTLQVRPCADVHAYLRTVYYSTIYCANLDLKTVKAKKSSDIKISKCKLLTLTFFLAVLMGQKQSKTPCSLKPIRI